MPTNVCIQCHNKFLVRPFPTSLHFNVVSFVSQYAIAVKEERTKQDICLSVCLSIFGSVCLSTCLPTAKESKRIVAMSSEMEYSFMWIIILLLIILQYHSNKFYDYSQWTLPQGITTLIDYVPIRFMINMTPFTDRD